MKSRHCTRNSGVKKFTIWLRPSCSSLYFLFTVRKNLAYRCSAPNLVKIGSVVFTKVKMYKSYRRNTEITEIIWVTRYQIYNVFVNLEFFFILVCYLKKSSTLFWLLKGSSYKLKTHWDLFLNQRGVDVTQTWIYHKWKF